MDIAVTERQVFKRCRRKWDFQSRNRQNLARIVPKEALNLGTLVHHALQDWMVQPDTSLAELFMRHSKDALIKASKLYQQNTGMRMGELEMQPLEDAIILGCSMMENYQNYWKVPLLANYQIVMPEQSVVMNIPGTPHNLKARLDAIVQDKNGRLYIVEHKTYSQHPNPRDLASNDQFLAYLWIANRLDIGHVVGIAYDGLWKRAKPPKGKTLSDLFQREILYRSTEELEEFERYLAEEAIEMSAVNQQDENVLYTNRTYQCPSDCDYETLCTAISRGEDSDYIKKHMFVVDRREDENESPQL